MSYILDALKKSDQERSLGSLRKLSTPYPDRSRRERRVVFVLIGLLAGLLALLIAVAWWYREPLGMLIRGEPVHGTAAPAMGPTREPTGATPVIDSTREVEPRADPAGESTGTTRRDADPGGSSGAIDAEATAPINRSGAADASTVPADAVPVSELPGALRERLPPLAVSVVSWSGDAARRFVMIDGGIFKEGDRMPAGIRVEKILRDRIELSMLSERFYIQPDISPRNP